MTPAIAERLKTILKRDMLIDLFDMASAKALAAHLNVVEHFGLDAKRARELEGQARFRMLEKGFEEITDRFGGFALDNDLIPGTDLRVYQPFRRFAGNDDGPGIILGLATMSAPETLPPKNHSRASAVSLNYDMTPRLDFTGKGAKLGDIFVLFLISRDRLSAGKIEEVAVGMIDANYESFAEYQPLNSFLAEYGAPPDGGGTPVDKVQLVTLKKSRKVFQPPEKPAKKDDDEMGG